MYFQNLGFIRTAVFGTALLLIVLSQCFWFLRVWRLAARVKSPASRYGLLLLWIGASALALAAFFSNLSFRGIFLQWHHPGLVALAGLWISSAMFAYLAVMIVHAIAWLWLLGCRVATRSSQSAETSEAPETPGVHLSAVDFPRRRFLHASSVIAGSIPFLGAGYGFAIERFAYQIREVALPVSGLPAALAGMHIAQLSDIHIGSFMSARDVRRVVDMTNELRADLTVVTGDFLTRRGDPLEACIAELSRLRAPLGVWGCNGNHEIYAGVEAEAQRLFARYGMVLLRQQSVELVHHGQPLNLIGVDYQRQLVGGQMLESIVPLVRRDVPNILLSHNPNTFARSANLGIELMLTGHTHGGQVRVEILDHRFSPAQFLTPYVAGTYLRPLHSRWDLQDRQVWREAPGAPASVVYVNRGLGTIGAPVRLGVPPEISLHTLRRA